MPDYIPYPLKIAPGLITEVSPYEARGRWIGGNNVRFWKGAPEKIGGWERAITPTLGNPARGNAAWSALDGTRYVAWGTADKLWLMEGNTLYDITPLGMTAGLVDGSDSWGWGQNAWGGGPWGGSSKFFSSASQPRVWTLYNWGQDLLACYRGGPLYIWERALGPTTRAAVVPGAPASMLTFFVAEQERYVVALGANDPMQIAWCNQGDITDWTATSTNTAGDKRLEIGSTIIGAADTQLGRLVLTDGAAYLVRYTGPPYIFAVNRVGGEAPPLGPNAIISNGGTAYWFGAGAFWAFNGSVQRLPCDVERSVMLNVNGTQSYKIFAGLNRRFGEVMWFYPDARDGRENSRYVAFNAEGWSLGTVARSSWLDDNVSTNYPIATAPDGTVYFHETGVDADGAALPYSITSGEVQLDEGGILMRTRKLIPDYQRISGTHTITLEGRGYPKSGARTKGPFVVTPATERISAHIRGRSVRVTISGDTVGSDMRLGEYRATVRPDGGRP